MIGYLDCSSGISGDKLLAALIDLGLDPRAVEDACERVGCSLEIRERRVEVAGISAVELTVTSDETDWRVWREIRTRLEQASLAEDVREGALRAFSLLAEAEARVHGVTPDDVHFHEIGAADTLADLLGVALGLSKLGIERLVCSPVALGGGTVRTEHGVLPVPAPATLELLAGVACHGGPVEAELTTPTGAALLRAHAASFGAMPPMTPSRTGRGAGSLRFDALANVATLTIGEASRLPEGFSAGGVTLLATSLDHITPEHAAYACERLLAEGALDVWQAPLAMKKGRLGIEVTVVCLPADETRLADVLARETGTLGIRVSRVERYEAARVSESHDTTLGRVRFKCGPHGMRPEHDDVAALASREGISYGEALRRIREESSG